MKGGKKKSDVVNNKGFHSKKMAITQVKKSLKRVGKEKEGSVLEKMRKKLQGGQFRWLNGEFYTNDGSHVQKLLQENPELFNQYHDGFKEQTKGWPIKPLDKAIEWLKGKPKSWRVADLGCGEAMLAAQVTQRVDSFDLIAKRPEVVACNMASLPLPDSCIDAAIFCLSLMGTDYGSFIEEATRVLKGNGWIWIAEVQSRFVDETGRNVLKSFVKQFQTLGFIVKRQDTSNSHFVIMEFQRNDSSSDVSTLQWPALRACQYKKR